MKLTALCFVSSLVSIGLQNFAGGANAANAVSEIPQSLTAPMILHRVSALYAEAKTYQDTGVVKIKIEGVGSSVSGAIGRIFAPSDIPFKTAYRAPDRFRFEFTAPHPRMIPMPQFHSVICRNGTDVELWAFSKVSMPHSLDQALAEASGISNLAAHDIPALLMPQIISGRKLTDDGAATRLADAPCGASRCFRVQESRTAASAVAWTEVIWIEQSSFLVRRIDMQLARPDHSGFDSTTTYDPVIDRPVTDAALKFNTPNGIVSEWVQYLAL